MMPKRARDADEKIKEWCDNQEVKRKQSQQQRPGLSKRALWGCILNFEAKQRCADPTMTGACRREYLPGPKVGKRGFVCFISLRAKLQTSAASALLCMGGG